MNEWVTKQDDLKEREWKKREKRGGREREREEEEEEQRKEENERSDDRGSGILFARVFLGASGIMPRRYNEAPLVSLLRADLFSRVALRSACEQQSC